MTSRTFYEGGHPYHFDCRPSQQVIVVGKREHADLLEHIAALEAENTRLRELLDHAVRSAENAVLQQRLQHTALAATREEAAAYRSCIAASIGGCPVPTKQTGNIKDTGNCYICKEKDHCNEYQTLSRWTPREEPREEGK